MKETKPTYKKQGNVTLFDSDETMEKFNKLGNCSMSSTLSWRRTI